MKARLPWHHTPFGRVALFLGSIKPAIPVLLATAGALAYGTWVESTESADAAKRVVYGSWWFIALMSYVSLALIFAVVVRYPWSRRHIGFMTVHAGLITVFVGGFISLFGRVEGTITLREGMASSHIEMNSRQLEYMEIPATRPVTVASVNLHPDPSANVGREFEIEGMTLRVVDQWKNARSEPIVLNDSADRMEAIEFAASPEAEEGTWLAQSNSDNPQARFAGVQLRLMPFNSNWKPAPPQPADEAEADADADHDHDHETEETATPQQPAAKATFVDGEGRAFVVTETGQIIDDAWRVRDLRFFDRATVGADGLVENPSGSPNPAVQIILEHLEDGSVERHITFANFPDMKMARRLEGESASGFALDLEHAGGPIATSDPHANESATNRLVFQNNFGEFTATWVKEDGSFEVFELTGEPPYEIDLNGRTLSILNHYTHARQGERFVQAPAGDQNRPVLIAEIAEGYDQRTIQIPWKGRKAFTREGEARPSFFVYGPQRHELPFRVELIDFRKNDYPGSTMAMEYESDVRWQPVHDHQPGDDHSNLPQPEEVKIWMNHPLEYDGWKVYQSGFMGDDISVFSVMKDPGLTTTYTGCIMLCLGILVIFYSRNYSHGHPGIGVFAKKKNRHAEAAADDSIPTTPESPLLAAPADRVPAASSDESHTLGHVAARSMTPNQPRSGMTNHHGASNGVHSQTEKAAV